MVEQLLLALKVAFVVLLYLFVWRVIRVASRDIAVGQESMVLTPAERPAALQTPSRAAGAAAWWSQAPSCPRAREIDLGRDLVAGT